MWWPLPARWVTCPYCGDTAAWLSRRGFWTWSYPLVGLRRYRCALCRQRFVANRRSREPERDPHAVPEE